MDVGDVLAGRYELLAEVGVGGMGRVLRARDRTLDRVVAVKLLAPHLLGDTDAVAALRDEARRAASVRHPNVVQVLDAVLDDTDQPAIVMEHVDGPTLASVVPDDGLPIDEALDVLAAVGAGLQAVHEAGLVHRDVTPGNVLLDDGVPRLTDFGIARSAAATSTQTVRGSVGYLAPEQASGAAVGPAADVYALGCLATTLLTGRPPFAAETPVGVVHQHLNEQPPDLRERRPEVPSDVAVRVAAMLAKDPSARPGSVASAVAALGSATKTAGIDHDPTTVLVSPSRTAVIEPARRWPPRAALVAIGLAALLAGAAVGVATRGDDTPEITAEPMAVPSPEMSPSPTPTPSPSPSPSPEPPPATPEEAAAAAISELRALLVDLRAQDAMTAEALEKLDERAAEAADKLRDGRTNDVAKAVRELRRQLRERVEKEEVTREAEHSILDQVLVVETAVNALPRGNRDEDDD